jgi:hypothetical protein
MEPRRLPRLEYSSHLCYLLQIWLGHMEAQASRLLKLRSPRVLRRHARRVRGSP